MTTASPDVDVIAYAEPVQMTLTSSVPVAAVIAVSIAESIAVAKSELLEYVAFAIVPV